MQKVSQEFEIVILKWQEIAKDESLNAEGVYQIYGTSPIYGLNALMYIGRSKDIGKRLIDHIENSFHLNRDPSLKFFFAEVSTENLNYVEETLICLHKPSANSTNVKSIKLHTRALYIQNWGNRGVLPIECTNYYYLDEFAKK